MRASWRGLLAGVLAAWSFAAAPLTLDELVGIWRFEYSDSVSVSESYNLNFEFRRDFVFRLNILNDPDCAPLFINGVYALGPDLGGFNLMDMALRGVTCGPVSLDLTQFATFEELGVGLFAVARIGERLAVIDLETEEVDVLARTDRLPTTPQFPAFTFESDAISADQLRVAARPPRGSENRDLIVELNLGPEFASRTLSASGEGRFASSQYKVYVAALVPGEVLGTPGQPQWFMRLPENAPQQWTVLSLPLRAYLENVAVGSADARLRIEVLRDLNLSSLRGTEFYIGYGLDEYEMLSAGRFRGFYRVN